MSTSAVDLQGLAVHDLLAPEDYLLRKAVIKLLEVKDSDVRICDVEQSRDDEDGNGAGSQHAAYDDGAHHPP